MRRMRPAWWRRTLSGAAGARRATVISIDRAGAGADGLDDLIKVDAFGESVSFRLSDRVDSVEKLPRTDGRRVKLLSPEGKRLGKGVKLGNLLLQKQDSLAASPGQRPVAFQLALEDDGAPPVSFQTLGLED
jgi:hypothetical protein